MHFEEQILEKNSNIIRSYTNLSITVLEKEYSYNVIVPPVNPVIKCNIKTDNISKENIIKYLSNEADFVIIALNNTGCFDKTPIILELNKMNVGVEIMSISSACSSHNILLAEQRDFLSFFIFK